MVGDEVRMVVRGQIMGLNKRIIRMFVYILKISGRTHKILLTLLSGYFMGIMVSSTLISYTPAGFGFLKVF